MSTRIRYIKTEEEGIFRTKQTFFISEAAEVAGLINLNENTFKIVAVEDGGLSTLVLDEGGERNDIELKKSLKAALIKMGVSFGAETRNRTNNTTSTGDGVSDQSIPRSASPIH